MKTHSRFVTFLLLLCLGARAIGAQEMFRNPVIPHNCPDPTVLDDRARTGWFYAYSTMSSRAECTGDLSARGSIVLPVYRSRDLINWEFVGDGFAGVGMPTWRKGARLWAPDINYVDGHYVLYYAMGVWGDLVASASGVAVSDSPTGPFIDHGLLVDYETIGVKNSIDPNLFIDHGKKYLIWGSLGGGSGVWGIRLSKDGFSIKKGAKPVQLGADNMEGSYMIRRGRWCYLFTSRGSCCEGARSTYHVLVARSRKPLGKFVGREGESLLAHDYPGVILSGTADSLFVGTGHNAQIISDDAGQDWMAYHAFWRQNGYRGRVMNLDRIVWSDDGWPSFHGGHPTPEQEKPIIKQ